MTSSSDTERLCQRRISVHGLPTNCPSSELRTLFSPYGGINAVHVTRLGHAFVTFDEEEAASAALSLNGALIHDQRISVELSQWHDNSALPVIGAKREMYFPRPFGGRGGQSNSSGGSYRSSSSGGGTSSSRPRNSGASGPNSSSSRSGRMGGSGPSASSGGGGGHHRTSLSNIIKVINVNPTENNSGDTAINLAEEDAQKFLLLMSFERFPEISRKIFGCLDLVSLLRCRLVSRDWARNIWKYVLNSTSAVERRRSAWCNATCSIYPLVTSIPPPMTSPPTATSASSAASSSSSAASEETPESRYRNILRIKADEKEILLALDNGNVEIYDRYTRKLSCVLSGQYSISPVGLDINADFILVSYTCAFVNRFRMPMMPSSWWSIFCRHTKKLLRVIEREAARNSEDIRLGCENLIYLVTKNSVYYIDFGANEFLRGATRIFPPNFTTKKVVSVHMADGPAAAAEVDHLEAVDFDSDKIVGVVKRGCVSNSANSNSDTVICVWRKPTLAELGSELGSRNSVQHRIDFMTRLESSFSIFEAAAGSADAAAANFGPNFDRSKCACLSVQFRYPLCLVLLSNNRGLFEVLNSCRPYVLFAICDVTKETTLRILTLDCAWMLRMSDMLVPYDCDTCVLTAKFNQDFLLAGFGSSSDLKDGGIAIWSMEELLNPDNIEDDIEPKVYTLPSPVYHWSGWDGHTGGVTTMHLDAWGLVAVNACKHQISTRCIERFDETKKDNVLVYDFWSPGRDERREQR